MKQKLQIQEILKTLCVKHFQNTILKKWIQRNRKGRVQVSIQIYTNYLPTMTPKVACFSIKSHKINLFGNQYLMVWTLSFFCHNHVVQITIALIQIYLVPYYGSFFFLFIVAYTSTERAEPRIVEGFTWTHLTCYKCVIIVDF